MYTIKIHFPCLTICMLSYESQRRGLYLLFTIRWQHSRQNVVRIENGGKMGLNPRAYPSRVQTQICTQKNLPQPLSIQIMKRKRKKRERFGWTQFKWLHGCIFRWQISELTHFCFSSVMSPDPEDSGLFFSKYTELAVDAWSNPRCTSGSTLALAFLWFTIFFKTFLVFDLWSVF